MEQALRWVNNPGVDDRGVGEWSWMMPRGRDDVGDWFKNKCSNVPWSACVNNEEGLILPCQDLGTLQLARSQRLLEGIRCF